MRVSISSHMNQCIHQIAILFNRASYEDHDGCTGKTLVYFHPQVHEIKEMNI